MAPGEAGFPLQQLLPSTAATNRDKRMTPFCLENLRLRTLAACSASRTSGLRGAQIKQRSHQNRSDSQLPFARDDRAKFWLLAPRYGLMPQSSNKEIDQFDPMTGGLKRRVASNKRSRSVPPPRCSWPPTGGRRLRPGVWTVVKPSETRPAIA